MLETGATSRARLRSKEGRAEHFFPVVVEVEYKLSVGYTPTKGHARTVGLSSSTVILESEQSFTIGQQIELSVAWPVALNERVGLRLWIRGCITGSSGGRVAVEIQRYDFRTRPRTLEGLAAAENPPETRTAPGPARNVVEIPRTGLRRSMLRQNL